MGDLGRKSLIQVDLRCICLFLPLQSFTRECSTATKSEPDEELLNVHALEHACNGRHAVCILGVSYLNVDVNIATYISWHS